MKCYKVMEYTYPRLAYESSDQDDAEKFKGLMNTLKPLDGSKYYKIEEVEVPE